MAIIKFGPTVVGARGTIAGTIFSANKAGPYVRGWSRSSNPRSTLQTATRAIFATSATLWADLTTPQQDDWIDYADDPPQELTNSLGETYFASGFNWYVRISAHLQAVGAARRDDAPTLLRPIAPTIQSFVVRSTGAAGQTRIDYTGEGPELLLLHGIIARSFLSQGRTVAAAGYTSMRIQVPDTNDQVLFQTELESAFGTIADGQRIFAQTFIQDAHGQRGPIDSAFANAVP